MIGWPPSVRRLDPFEPQFSKIERIDKRVDHSNRTVFVDPVVQAFRKQRTPSAIRPLYEALHAIPATPQWIITRGRFHTARVNLRRPATATTLPVYPQELNCLQTGGTAGVCHIRTSFPTR